MIVKALAKTLYSISVILAKHAKQDMMMSHHLKLCRTQTSAISKR
jgi:hypothetical protein